MKSVRKLTRSELRRLILNEVNSVKSSNMGRRSLVDLLFEQDNLAQAVQTADAKPVTLVILYGPPAAGKGAAKKDVGDFAGIKADKNYKKWLKSIGKDDAAAFFQEEDEAMVDAMTEILPPLVFREIAKRVGAGENFDDVVSEYYHVNESDKNFDLDDILTKKTFEKLLATNDNNVDAAAEEFANFPNTIAYFTQARGFSKPIDGAPEELNAALGTTGPGDQTLGARIMAAGKYMDDVRDEISDMGAKEMGDSTYASIYLMDQSGESSANVDRIKSLGKLKADENFPAVTLIGVYIAQPQERTEIANLHRAAHGGRRVSSKEVQRIFDTGPKFTDDGKLDKGNLGSAIDAMMDSGQGNFDQVHVYYPPNPFRPSDAKEFSSRICNPLGSGTGALDIEGCEETGPDTTAKSLPGMEKLAVKKADVEDLSDDEGLPAADKMSDEQKEKVVVALNRMGFQSDVSGLEKYLETISPPGIRGGGEHGKVPWAKELFMEPGRNPTERETLKGAKSESARTRKSTDDLIMERWRKLAGLL
jgi:hypothetical protein